MLNPRSSSATIEPCVDERRRSRPAAAPRRRRACRPSARIWNCSSKSPDRLDLDLVVGLRVDQVVEDLLVGGDLLGLAGTHQVHLAGVLRRPRSYGARRYSLLLSSSSCYRTPAAMHATTRTPSTSQSRVLPQSSCASPCRPNSLCPPRPVVDRRRCLTRRRDRRSAGGACRRRARPARPSVTCVRGLSRASSVECPPAACSRPARVLPGRRRARAPSRRR